MISIVSTGDHRQRRILPQQLSSPSARQKSSVNRLPLVQKARKDIFRGASYLRLAHKAPPRCSSVFSRPWKINWTIFSKIQSFCILTICSGAAPVRLCRRIGNSVTRYWSIEKRLTQSANSATTNLTLRPGQGEASDLRSYASATVLLLDRTQP